MTGYISANPPSRIGLALRSSTNYASFSQIDTADEAKFQLDSSGGWKVYNSGAAIDSSLGASADATLTIKLTSGNTFNATVVRSGTTFNTYDVPMITGGGSIRSFGVFAVNSASDTFWKNGSLSDSGTVEFGNGNGSSLVSGVISDGMPANAASGTTVNTLTKSGTGTITLGGANSYSGGTIINGGILSVSSDGNLGATNGNVTINGGFNSVLAISNSTTLNASRTITIGASGGKLDAGNNTLTIAGSLVNNSGNNHMFILANGNTTVTGNATGTGDIVKQGTGTLTLNGAANTFGTTSANLYIDNGIVQGVSSNAFGQTSTGNGAITMGADAAVNNGTSTLLLTGSGAAVSNAVNIRHYSTFNAAKNVGGNNSTGTVTYNGNLKLNDTVNLTAASGGTVAFNGIIQQGTAGGSPAQDVNGTPGITIIGGGTVMLGAANTYTGNTTVSNGTLALGASGVLASATTVNLAGGTLAMGAFNNTVSALQFSGTGKARGTWGSTNSTANHKNIQFTGTGILTVSSGGSASTVVASSANPSIYGGSVTFTATVTSSGGIPTGTVTFKDGATTLGTGTLSGGSGNTASATLTLTNLTAATHSITAVYGGDDSFDVSTSSALSQVINTRAVTLSGTRAYDGTTTATSSLLTIGNNLDGANLTLSGSANLASSNVGLQNITSFAGLSLGGAAVGNYTLSGASGSVTITKAASSIALTSATNPSGYKNSISFTATLPTTASGNVIFLTASGAFSTNALVSGSAGSLSITNLPRGTNLITVQYGGDGNYLGSTNTLNQIVTNHPPVVADVTYYRSKDTSFKIPITSLLTNATDVDGDTLGLQSVGASTNGATILTNGTYVYYVPVSGTNTNDSFTYTVNDGFGGSTLANIAVVVYSAAGPAQLSAPSNGVVNITFFGIPNYTYVVQTTTNLSTPWWNLSTNTAGTNGSWFFTDPNATNAQQYYRSAQP